MATGTIKQSMMFFPDYDNSTLITNNTTYTVPNDGYVIGRRVLTSAAGSIITINSLVVYTTATTGTDLGGVIYPVKKGDIVKLTNLASNSTIYFVPIKH